MPKNTLYFVSNLELVLFYSLNALLAVETLVKLQLVLEILLLFDLELYLEVIVHYLLFLLVDERVSLGDDATDLILVLVVIAFFYDLI